MVTPSDSSLFPLRLQLVGQMKAWSVGNKDVLPVGRKTRALLAVIALAAPEPVMRRRLTELLWSQRPKEQAGASLRQEIHRLNDALALGGIEALDVRRDRIGFHPGMVLTDIDPMLKDIPALYPTVNCLKTCMRLIQGLILGWRIRDSG
jgi:DNA-binding SARP family transcriptional activator